MIDSADNPAPEENPPAPPAKKTTKKATKKSAPAPNADPAEALPDTPPQGAPELGMKDPAVIRWHLAKHPGKMAEIYGPFDWRKALKQDLDE